MAEQYYCLECRADVEWDDLTGCNRCRCAYSPSPWAKKHRGGTICGWAIVILCCVIAVLLANSCG